MIQGTGSLGTAEDRLSCAVKMTRCPDCFQCQGCSEDRCRLCRKHGHPPAPTLAEGFTYGEYLEWKKRQSMSVQQDEGRR